MHTHHKQTLQHTQCSTPTTPTKIVDVNGNNTDIECHIVFNTSPQPELSIHYEDFRTLHQHIPDPGRAPECTIKLANGLSGTFFAPRLSHSPYKLIPVVQPITVNCGKKLQNVHFKLLNGPGSLSKGDVFFGQHNEQITIKETYRHRGGQILTVPPWSIHIVECIQSAPIYDSTDVDYIMSHQGCLTRIDGRQFKMPEAEHILELLRLLCSFVNGASCGVACVEGENKEGEIVWERYGTHHTAPRGVYSSILTGQIWPDNCTDSRCGAVMQDLFPGFISCGQSPGWYLLENSLLWYLKSNETSETVVSIVLNQIALECLSNYVAKHVLAGKATAGKDRLGKMTDALSWVKVDPADSQGCSELDQACKLYSKDDILHTLIEIRNNLSHANPNMKLSDPLCFEAARLGFWYVELLLLKIFGFNGMYRNRMTLLNERVPWG